jgi:hypothetical protein
MSNTKEAIAKSPSGRVKRTPVGVRNVLTIGNKDPNFVYRTVTDEGDRVETFKDAGYEMVPAKDVRIGDKRVNAASAEGSMAQTAIGGGKKGIVMRIPKEWYDEDQQAKLQQNADLEAATKAKALDGTYGKLQVSRD